jgi:hypothetical protein
VTQSPADTVKVLPGTYEWRAYVTKGSGLTLERYQIGAGVLIVQKDFATAQGDQRTHATKMLALVEAALEGRILTQEEQYALGSRSMTKLSIPELYKLRARYILEVRREQSGGATPIQTVETVFNGVPDLTTFPTTGG